MHPLFHRINSRSISHYCRTVGLLAWGLVVYPDFMMLVGSDPMLGLSLLKRFRVSGRDPPTHDNVRARRQP